MKLQAMITKAVITEGTCSAGEFPTADNNLPVCQDCDDDIWMTDFLAEIGLRNKVEHICECQQLEKGDKEDEGKDVFFGPVQAKLTTFREAILSLEAIAVFLNYKGYTSEATHVSHIMDVVATLSYSDLSMRPGNYR